MFDFLKQGQISDKDIEASIKQLPLPEKIRALAIFKRYKKIKEIQTKMNDKIKAVEKQYLKHDAPVLDKISLLVEGKKDIEETDLVDLDKYLTKEEQENVKDHLKARKLPDYWFKVLSNAEIIKQNIGKDDEPLLKSLENIRVQDEEGTDNFTIVFEFSENEFINDARLTKRFVIKKDLPVKTEATKIQWKGKNLTVKEIKKKQKNKKTGQQRVVTKTVENKSFFTFFRDVEIPEDLNDLEATEEQLNLRQKLDDDFEFAGILVDEVLPYSLEYYLGIEHEDHQHDEDCDHDEDEDDDDGDGEGEKKKKSSKSKSKENSKNKPKKGKDNAQKPDCKTQ